VEWGFSEWRNGKKEKGKRGKAYLGMVEKKKRGKEEIH
jgi:hypothetical protein